MAYVVPTPADLKAAFPAFVGVADPVVQQALDEAANFVDQSWSEATFTVARELYACHVMYLEGLGAGAGAAIIGLAGAGVVKYKAGDTEIQFAKPTGGIGLIGSASWYASSPYGQRFYRLLRPQFAGPRVY